MSNRSRKRSETVSGKAYMIAVDSSASNSKRFDGLRRRLLFDSRSLGLSCEEGLGGVTMRAWEPSRDPSLSFDSWLLESPESELGTS